MGVLWANFVAIYRRELQSYFASPLSFGIAGVYWFLSGLFYILILGRIVNAVAQQDSQGQLGVTLPAVDVPAVILENYLGVLGTLSLFILPFLSMGLFAQERQQGTLELLATSPVTTTVVALGKLAAVVTFFFTLTLPPLVYELATLLTSQPPFSWGVILIGHAGLILLAAAILALGLFLSALTESNLLSAISTFGLMLVLWILQAIADPIQGPAGQVLRHLSLLQHFSQLAQGLVSLSSVVLFLSYILLGLFLTVQYVDGLRFQRV